jgi:dCTP deaminase
MILTGHEIEAELMRGVIHIDPFERQYLNPNSYNYRLAADLRICRDDVLDPTEPGNWATVRIPEEGFILRPHVLYLGSTIERIGSFSYVPSLIGRSSLGRLGMFLQTSADLGNLGAIHSWTLEIKVVQKLRIYAGMIAGQVSFWRPAGDIHPYSGVYHKFSGATPSQRLGKHLIGVDDTNGSRDS